jgi:hypothetical protein
MRHAVWVRLGDRNGGFQRTPFGDGLVAVNEW